MNAVEQLKSVLCDPEGKCCIAGSDEDRAIIDRALKALAAPVQEPLGYVHLEEVQMLRLVDGMRARLSKMPDGPCTQPIYTTPPAALQPEQEPVAFFDWYDNAIWGNEDFKEGCHRSWHAAITYATPPAAQRTWVGLRAEEFHDLQIENIDDPWANFKAIEAKLKEKNT